MNGMKWIAVACESLLYLWGLYTLSFNPDTFPDSAFARKQWDKRAARLGWLGSVIFTSTLLFTGTIEAWWIVLVVLLGSVFFVTLIQPAFVGLIILGRAWKGILCMKLGLKPRRPRLAPIAWSYFLT